MIWFVILMGVIGLIMLGHLVTMLERIATAAELIAERMKPIAKRADEDDFETMCRRHIQKLNSL